MTTRYIPITPLNFHSEIRVDTQGAEVSISVYNCDFNHIDLLIMQLEALKAEHDDQLIAQHERDNHEAYVNSLNDPQHAHIGSWDAPDEPPQMTAVLGKKPESTDWYKNALQKATKLEPYKYVAPATVYEPDPQMPILHKGIHTINVVGVTSKQHKNYGGVVNPDMNADIIKNESIRIYGLSDKRHKWDAETKTNIYYKVAYDRTFKMGDVVEYESYNFAYTGKIVAIGEKTVKIEYSHGGKVSQLSLHEFINRNWDLDLKKIAEDRANWYD